MASSQFKAGLTLQAKEADLSAQLKEVEIQADYMSKVLNMVSKVQTEKRNLEVKVAALHTESQEEKAKADFAHIRQVSAFPFCQDDY